MVPVQSEGLGDRHDDARLACALGSIGHKESVLLAGADNGEAADPARAADVVRRAELVVVEAILAHAELLTVLDLLPADVGDDTKAAAQVERAGEVEVLRALRVDSAGQTERPAVQSEEVGE